MSINFRYIKVKLTSDGSLKFENQTWLFNRGKTCYAQLYNSAVKKRREISTENLQNEDHLQISLTFRETANLHLP